MTTATRNTVDIILTSTPTLEQMKMWWAELVHDPCRTQAYTDGMPWELEDFMGRVRQGEITVWMFIVDTGLTTHIGGAFYLHDAGHDAAGPYAWLGTYVVPAYRGRLAACAWRLLRHQCAQDGLVRLFAAIRHSNRPAQRFITQAMGFTRLGTFVDWASFAGTRDTVILYTLRAEDQTLAWSSATYRAQHMRVQSPAVRGSDRLSLFATAQENSV